MARWLAATGSGVDDIDVLLVERPLRLSPPSPSQLRPILPSAANGPPLRMSASAGAPLRALFGQPRAKAAKPAARALAPLPALRNLGAAHRRRASAWQLQASSPAPSDASDVSTVLDRSELERSPSSALGDAAPTPVQPTGSGALTRLSEARVLHFEYAARAARTAELPPISTPHAPTSSDDSVVAATGWLPEHLARLRGADVSRPAGAADGSPPRGKYPSGMAELRARRERAAVRLQRAARRVLVGRSRRLDALRSAAAARVQARFRGNAGRALAARMRAERAEHAERVALALARARAARVLQACVRGLATRAALDGARRADAAARAAARIAAGALGFVVRRAQRMRRAHAAATAVQAVARGNAQRAGLDRHAAEAREKRVAERAAVVLRAAARAHVGRRGAAWSSAALVLQRRWRVLRRMRAEARAAARVATTCAAVFVQTWWREAVALATVRRALTEENEAARAGRARSAERAHAAHVRAMGAASAAATTIAACVRGRRARAVTIRARGHARARHARALWRALRRWRGEAGRLAGARLALVRMLQSAFRGNAARATLARARVRVDLGRSLVGLVDAAPRPQERANDGGRPRAPARVGVPRSAEAAEAAATVVQARYRGNLARAGYQRANCALSFLSVSEAFGGGSPLGGELAGVWHGSEPAVTERARARKGRGEAAGVRPRSSVEDGRATRGADEPGARHGGRAGRPDVCALLAALREAARWERSL
ncbi:hypothetical protein KFE25_000695 [Diacronema lutheri]|uniref:Uncharacterized protein n=1 Tax=Diacronema lutheri TaxID=2081491 RepID=A0A8J6CCB2_DIALT|nr:hypothetical protein KFE25_000695 [Diacronema lutheri]